MKIENLSFYEALKKLADMANIVLPQTSEKSSDNIAKAKERRERMYEINKVAAQFFYDNLRDGKDCVAYLKKRAISGDCARKFWLGYA